MCQPDEPAAPAAEHDEPTVVAMYEQYEAELLTRLGEQSLTRLYELDQRTQSLFFPAEGAGSLESSDRGQALHWRRVCQWHAPCESKI